MLVAQKWMPRSHQGLLAETLLWHLILAGPGPMMMVLAQYNTELLTLMLDVAEVGVAGSISDNTTTNIDGYGRRTHQ